MGWSLVALISAAVISYGWAQQSIPSNNSSSDACQLLHQLVNSGTLSELRWPKFSSCQSHVANFYESTGYGLAWTREGEITSQAQSIMRVFQDAAAKGLDPEDYDGSRWQARLAHLRPACAQPSDQDLIHFDLALTISAMRYVSDLHIGKVNPKVFCFGLDVDEKRCDVAEFLRERLVHAPDVSAVLEHLEPPFEAYRQTVSALRTYLALARDDDGGSLPITKKPVEPGDLYLGIARLQRLLRRLGDLPSDITIPPNSQLYQGHLVEAVKHFQTRHGLDPDGRIGTATLKQLNTPLKRRVRQLQLALERWRWIPDRFPRPPIIVNIPEFRLHAYNDRYQPELETKVVVGLAFRRQTPIFADEMTQVIFRPYWHVPLSIQIAELVPKVKKDPAYLENNDYQIVDADGRTIEGAPMTGDRFAQLRSGQLSIRQKPGVKNALGLVKFIFPNEHNVYLHGTPAKALFSKSRRDFSHGCIRVEKPEELAVWVLRDQPGWDMERIREAETGPKSTSVNLTKTIPILIVYSTAVVRESGEVYFFDDIYKHDAALEELLNNGYPYSDWKPVSAARGPRPRE